MGGSTQFAEIEYYDLFAEFTFDKTVLKNTLLKKVFYMIVK